MLDTLDHTASRQPWATGLLSGSATERGLVPLPAGESLDGVASSRGSPVVAKGQATTETALADPPEPKSTQATMDIVLTVSSDAGVTTVIEDAGEIRVRGERFRIEFADGFVHLMHSRWSLAGSGSTLQDAYLDLLREAAELAEVMQSFDPTTMDDDARALQRFVLLFFGLS